MTSASTRDATTFSIGREQFHVSEEFLAKYNRPGPRYTSYPTAPIWHDDFSPADAEQVFRDADRDSRPVDRKSVV